MNLIAASDLSAYRHLPKGSLVGVRPEDMTVGAEGVEANVEGVEYLGADQLIAARVGAARIIVRQPARTGTPDKTIRLSWPAEATHLFDADGRRLQ
ncbi:MAG: TOBE domain-containing protein [Aliihoeflea sp.]